MSGKRNRKTSAAVAIIRRRYFGGRSGRAALEEARASAKIARKIYEIRTRAGLTQQQLADLVGTTPSSICRLEDDDYEGHSLTMLRRIAAVLDYRVDVRFVRLGRRSA